MRLSFYACVDCKDVWFQGLKTQNLEFSADRKIPIENSKLSVLRRVLRFELAWMSILCTSLEYYSSFYCFTKYFVEVSTKITVSTLLSFQAVISNLKTQLHEENTRWKRSSQHSLNMRLNVWDVNICIYISIPFFKILRSVPGIVALVKQKHKSTLVKWNTCAGKHKCMPGLKFWKI